MKAAICDDEKIQIESTVTFLEEYIHDRRISIDYEYFESYTQLKDRISEFDLFILDYQVPEINGIEFAEMLRSSYGEEKAVIFLTSFPEIVYESFKVRPHRFLIKPIDKEKFYEALDSYFKTNHISKRIFIKTLGDTQVVNLDDVYYIEASRKDVCINKENEQLVYHKSITDMEAQLSSFGFFRCHRSFLVNLKKVKKFDSKTVWLTNGVELPMGAKKLTEFNKEYLRNAK